jgi:uncharacterized protein
MIFLDSNIILRYLTRDDPGKAENCYLLFQKAKTGEIKLITSEAIITEVVYVLSSENLYKLSRNEIQLLLTPIITLKGLKLSQKKLYLRALEVYALKNIDFEDALSFAYMENRKVKEIYSYDRDFDKLDGINRIEP